MKTINLNSSKENDQLISDIVERATTLMDVKDKQGLEMDIICVHLNDTKLRLKDLLDADNFNFLHDVCGINNNINRKTGKLENCFLPRFSR